MANVDINIERDEEKKSGGKKRGQKANNTVQLERRGQASPNDP